MWRKLLEEGGIDWDDVANKPTAYPPKSHKHEIYADSSFVYKEHKYDLHDVLSQVVEFLENSFDFRLR